MTAQGTKHDGGKARYDLLPPAALAALADVFTYGAGKYGDRNWEKGLTLDRLFAAAQRHLWAWRDGEKSDPESGLSHVAHAMANLAMIVHFEAHKRPRFGTRIRSRRTGKVYRVTRVDPTGYRVIEHDRDEGSAFVVAADALQTHYEVLPHA